MDKRVIDQVCQKIYQRYPIVKGELPKITKQGDDRYLMVFSSKGETPDGSFIKQMIRVVATEQGQIIKTSMSK